MKKIICLALMMLLCLGLFTVVASAASASGYLSGPDTVQAGDTITVTFGINGTNIFGIEGDLSYDSSKLTLVSTSAAIGGSWQVESNGGTVIAYDNNQTDPINGSSDIFTATFRVDSNLAAGTRIEVSYSGVASDVNEGVDISGSYSTVLVQPKENLDLQSLSVSNGTLSPAFKPSVTNYTVKIPHGDSKVKVSAVPADSSATVTVSDTSIKEGETKEITVTVTSASGATNTYTISATREKAPMVPDDDGGNEEQESSKPSEESKNPDDGGKNPDEGKKPDDGKKPTDESSKPAEESSKADEESSEASQESKPEESKPSKDDEDEKAPSNELKELDVNDGELSPAFDGEITEYTVETDRELTVEDIVAEVADPDATVSVEMEESENGQIFTVTVTAADGSEKVYTITNDAPEEEEDVPAVTVPGKCGFNCPCIWLWIVTLVLLAAVTAVMFVLYGKLRKEKK